MSQSVQVSWEALSASRAALYGWLASLFAQELTQEQYLCYQRGEAQALLDLFETIGLEPESRRLGAAIAALDPQGQGSIDLRSDFSHLFLLDARHSALPYASFYLESNRQLYGEAEQRMRSFLGQSGLRVDQDFREPADHLSVYLAVMEKWAAQGDAGPPQQMAALATEQAAFLRDALLSWLPAFAERARAAQGLSSDFYPALADLLLAFVRADVQALQELSQELEGHAH